MKLSKAVPQNSLGVQGQVATSMIAFGVVWALIGTRRDDPFRIPQRVITGAIAATLNVAITYWRLPRPDRLGPLSAIGLGMFNGALVLWLTANRDPSVHHGVVAYLLFVPLMAAPLYLFVSGILQWRGDTGLAGRR
jgi:hypothetical protein